VPRKKNATALAIIDLDRLEPKHIARDRDLALLGERARAELEWIEHAERMTPVRAIFLGIILAQIRAGLPHGDWGPWMVKHFGAKKSTAYRFISLAKACVADARITMAELVALPEISTDFKPTDPRAHAARGLKRIIRWVGPRSLRELQAEYGRSNRPAGLIEKAAKKVAMPEAARQLAKAELSQWIEDGRSLLLDENRTALLLPEEVRSFSDGLDAVITRWRRAMKKILQTA
jgi:hypothetical protein